MKKQVIETLQNTLEWVMQEWINTKQELAEANIQIENDWIAYEDLMWLYVKQRTELEETQEALRRNRNQLESYKCYEKSCINYREIVSKYDKEIAMYENMSVWKFIKNRLVKR